MSHTMPYEIVKENIVRQRSNSRHRRSYLLIALGGLEIYIIIVNTLNNSVILALLVHVSNYIWQTLNLIYLR
jgi:hypothetical protein